MSISSKFPSIRPSLLLDFANVGRLDPRITFTRASTATYFNELGVLTTAGSGVARFDYDPSTLQPRGLLIEEQRTNSIRNNTMQGAVAGTPGTLPTNWVTQNVGGVARTEVVGVGVEDGITYVDIRYTGTTSSAATGGIISESSSVAASTGQTWTSSFYVRLVGGSTAGLTSINNNILERDSGGTAVAGTSTVITPTNAALNTQRVSTTATLSNASTALVQQRVAIIPQSGVAIDITLRIGLPQLELGAFATSVIPTTTTALTRNADAASMTGTNFSSWYNAAEGTVFGEYQTVSAGTTQFLAAITSVSETDRITLGQTTTTYVGTVVDTGSTQASITQGTTSLNVAKISLAYAVNNFAFSANGAAPNTDTSGTVPSGVTEMKLGRRGTSTSPLNGWLRRVTYYPTRLPDATLVALTA